MYGGAKLESLVLVNVGRYNTEHPPAVISRRLRMIGNGESWSDPSLCDTGHCDIPQRMMARMESHAERTGGGCLSDGMYGFTPHYLTVFLDPRLPRHPSMLEMLSRRADTYIRDAGKASFRKLYCSSKLSCDEPTIDMLLRHFNVTMINREIFSQTSNDIDAYVTDLARYGGVSLQTAMQMGIPIIGSEVLKTIYRNAFDGGVLPLEAFYRYLLDDSRFNAVIRHFRIIHS